MSPTIPVARDRPLLDAIRQTRSTDSPASGDEPPLRADGGEEPADDEAEDHLRDVPDGAGCTEIWEYLSERDAGEVRADD